MSTRPLIVSTMLALFTLWSAAASEAATRARSRAEPGLNDPVVRLAASASHSCQVNDDGTVRCWGRNAFGQLGDGTTTDRLTPVTVGGVTNAVAVTAGGIHTCALLADGSARCWGLNGSGQLGDGTTVDRPTPVPVSGLANAVALAAGIYHTCALLADGSVRCWGYDGFGELGNGNTTEEPAPAPGAVSGIINAVAITAANNHTCVLLADSTARCWGRNDVGQLGDGTTVRRPTPVSVSGLASAVSIQAGAFHTCALLAGGGVRCWGLNGSGQLGDGTTTGRPTAVGVSGLVNAVAIAAGGNHTCALLADGTARCWGRGTFGQLGEGSAVNRLTPVGVSGLINAVALAAGESHACALRVDGSARCWGFNGSGQLGNGTTVDSVVPSPVTGGGGSITARDIAAGDLHTCAARANGTVSCWGYNNHGELGNGSTVNSLTAVQVSGLSTAVAVAAGGNHTCALLANGRAHCWGYDAFGQLGDGFNVLSRSTPVPVSGLTNAVALAAGGVHTCALLANGTVRCWGSNRSGQLGDGTTVNRSTPVLVTGLNNAVAVAAGGFHTCALLADGSARCWGSNGLGQLGDGSITTRLTPASVSGLFGTAAAITAGYSHTCALLADGSARCWGANDAGQLGDGAAVSRSIPGPVIGLANAVAISGGSRHSCGLVAGGGARCWGANQAGQLGDGTTIPRLTPTVVTSQSKTLVTTLGVTTQVVTGESHACALQASGAVRCWGSNALGQVGDGTTVNKLRAVAVPSVTLNIDPRVILEHNTREATVTILALCEEGQELHVDVTLTQGAASGHGAGGGECTGGLARYPVTVTVEGHDVYELGPADAQAEGVILEDGAIVDTQEWTRQVQIAGPAPVLEGSASGVGTGTDSASLRLTGQFTVASSIALDQATLTITALLDEAGGAGELVRGDGGARLLPLTLRARVGGKPGEAIYQTAAGARPAVWAEVKNRDPRTGLMEFSIKVDRATIPLGPALCSAASPATTELHTRFGLQVGGGTPVGAEVIVPWRCLGTQMRTP